MECDGSGHPTPTHAPRAGIGKQAALELARRGYNLTVTDLDAAGIMHMVRLAGCVVLQWHPAPP